MDSDSNKKSISVASVTDSITRIEKILPKVIDNYKSAVGKPANSVEYNDKAAKDKNNASLIDSLSKQVSSLTRENIELKNENSELANALEDLHQEYMKLESHANNNKPSPGPKTDSTNQKFLVENEALMVQNANFRAEIFRLQAEVDNIKAYAIQAVDQLKTFSKNFDQNSDLSTIFDNTFKRSGNNFADSQIKTPIFKDDLLDKSKKISTKSQKSSSHEKKSNDDHDNSEELSPVVEERLLYTVFDKYKAEASGFMPLSRLIRFSKEFGIIPGGNCEQRSPMLVAGDIDVLYKVSLLVKTDAIDDNKKGAEGSYHKHFLSVRRSPKAVNYAANSLMNVYQFIQVMRQVAVKLYANQIEQQTGNAFEYLAPPQKEMASKAALEILIQQKILPKADRLGLIPWPLIHFDKTLSILNKNFEPYQTLKLMADKLETWFLLYIPQNLSSNSASSSNSMTNNGRSKHWGITYKGISRFFHDVGIVPTLMNEPQLYSLYEEVLRWVQTDPTHLWKCLPQELTELDVSKFEIQFRSSSSSSFSHETSVGDKESSGGPKNSLGLLSFSLLIATVSTQVLPDLPSENRLTGLFEWIDKNEDAVDN